MEHNQNTEPKLDALTATLMLENIFEESNVKPNTIPATALTGFRQTQPRRFLPQRIILIIVLVIWLLLPWLFVKPDCEMSQVRMNEQNLPVYTIEVSSLLPVDRVEAFLNGEELTLYAKDQKTYAVEPDQNGSLEVHVTAVNRQTTARSAEVTTVDDMGPKLIRSRIDDSRVYLQLAENGTGIAWENIYAIGADSGDIVLPESYDKKSCTVAFDFPEERFDVYIPDRRGNALHLSMEMR